MHARIRVVSCVVMNQFNKKEGYVKVLGFRLFYRAFVPSAPKGTLLCLHGGPGACHDYMLPLANLANSGYMVLFYDQLGCGRSEVPRNLALFTVERSVEEKNEIGKGTFTWLKLRRTFGPHLCSKISEESEKLDYDWRACQCSSCDRRDEPTKE